MLESLSAGQLLSQLHTDTMKNLMLTYGVVLGGAGGWVGSGIIHL